MLSEREISAAVGTTAYGADGDKIGTVEHFFVDDRTGVPTWVSVTTGLFGTRRSVVPAVDATFDDGSLRLSVTAEAVKSAPDLAGEDHLDPAEEVELRRHYGLEPTGGAATDGRSSEERGGAEPDGTWRSDSAGPDAAALAAPTQEMAAVPPPPPADDDPDRRVTDGGMVRSEERLVVGTERVARTRTRLVKYVVTEEVQITVPIRREEIRVEEVPLDAPDPGPGESLLAGHGDHRAEGSPAGGPQSAGELPDEIILHTERPVVSVQVVPVERVRVRTEVIQGQETVSGQVQREQIVVDESAAPRATPRH